MTPRGRVLMVQGTSSHAGKTTLVAALCRLFARAGYRVAPFKAQNMSNNAAVTASGEEVGRAQAMQAMAAGTAITVDMNPILLKPQSDQSSQVVVLGRARYTRNAREYYACRDELWPVVTGALDRLRSAYDIVVIEGAGSPAEINLAQFDIVNMRVALYSNAPVLLIGDIERGGVFASLFGTVALLTDEERARIKGFIINKFRGDASLLPPGFDALLERTGIPTLGVLPYLDLRTIPAEDALDWTRVSRAHANAAIEIAVVRLPRIANLDEFQPLANEPGVRVRFVGSIDEVEKPDLLIIPGTKATMADLAWLRDRGLAQRIVELRHDGIPIMGICGGFQMLGRRLVDPTGVESLGSVDGLGLLPTSTTFEANKVTRRVVAHPLARTFLWDISDDARRRDQELDAYEIHLGRMSFESPDADCRGVFEIDVDGMRHEDGAMSDDGLVIGTYLHGLFENTSIRRCLIRELAKRKSVSIPEFAAAESIDAALDRLSDEVCRSLDMPTIFSLLDLPTPTT